MLINIICLIVIAGAGYWFWLRPILMQRPEIRDFYADEATFFQALSGKLAGIKQKLAGAIVTLGALYVEAANYIMPALTGVDTSVWTKNIPDWVVPLIPIAMVSLLNYFRSLADKRQDGG